ncbi:MAG: hypothetical protein LBG27_02460 [Spirochaetaceae bacterium]|jgi:hypothetical protein|nr:hypothetical protein [Spirochaetaceae bacterium]
MHKKFFLFVMTALLGASLFLVGCPTEPEEKIVDRTTMIYLDVSVSDVDVLEGYLADDGKTLYIGVTGSLTLNENVVLPAKKAVYILPGASLTLSTYDLTVDGIVYVGGTLTATNTGAVKIPGSGHVGVVKDGTLSVKNAASVNDGATTPVTVLGTGKVGFATETFLTLADATNTIANIKAALGYFSNGTLTVAASTEVIALKPSAAAAAFGGLVSASRQLAVVADGAEDGTAPGVPAGLVLTVADNLAAVATLTADGTLAAASGTFAGLATATGTGFLTAGAAGAAKAPLIIESALAYAELAATGAVTDAGLVIPADTARVFTGAAAPSADVAVNGTVVVSGGSLAIVADGTLTVAGAGKVTAGPITIGPGTWLASNAGTAIAPDVITLGGNATANTFTASGGTVTLGQDGNKLTVTGSEAAETLVTGAAAGITVKGGLDVTAATVDISAAATGVISMTGGDVMTLSNGGGIIVADSANATATNTCGIDDLTIGTGVTVKAAAAGAAQDASGFTGSASASTITASGDVDIRDGLTTGS